MPMLVRRVSTGVARPLKVLIPLIKDDLRQATEAGLEYYRRAGDKLRESRAQVATHRWGVWLGQNFDLSRKTAWRYMRLSERFEEGTVPPGDPASSARASYYAVLHPDRNESKREATATARPVREAIRDVDVDMFRVAAARVERDEETRLHRELAIQLIDIGFKALATRLHPDHGGSREAMRRLNRVRDELKSVAETRRFE